WRGSPIFEGADFLVCAANPNVEDTKFHLVGFCNAGSFMLDDPDLSGSWKNCNCFHLFDSSFIGSNCAPSPISSLSLYFTSLCGCTRLNRIGGRRSAAIRPIHAITTTVISARPKVLFSETTDDTRTEPTIAVPSDDPRLEMLRDKP